MVTMVILVIKNVISKGRRRGVPPQSALADGGGAR
jgi:hypothetical protein